MIYDSLRTLPVVTACDIMETGNIRLLTDDMTIPDETLNELWEKLHEDFEEKRTGKKSGQNQEFLTYRQIDYLSYRMTIIKRACEALSFAHDPNLIEILREYGYTFDEGRYQESLSRISREADGINAKISLLKRGIEKPEAQSKTTIIDAMSAVVAILGIDLDFYSISCEKWFAIEEATNQKLKAMAESQPKPNKASK